MKNEYGEWKPLTEDYKGEKLNYFNLRWKQIDGTLSLLGLGKKREDSILVYFEKYDDMKGWVYGLNFEENNKPCWIRA